MNGSLRKAAVRSNEEQSIGRTRGGGWRRQSQRGSVGERQIEREEDRGKLRVPAESERVRRARRPNRERRPGAREARKRKGGREGERERKRVRVRVFSTSTQPGWRRIAAQCSSNGAALRRDDAAAPCVTNRPISGTRERRLSFGEARTNGVHPRSRRVSSGACRGEPQALAEVLSRPPRRSRAAIHGG